MLACNLHSWLSLLGAYHCLKRVIYEQHAHSLGKRPNFSTEWPHVVLQPISCLPTHFMLSHPTWSE